MEWQAVAGIVLGYVGQWLKAFQKFPTPLVQAVIAILAVGLYSLQARPELTAAWFTEAIKFALAALGVSSVAAGARFAPPTDSIPK